MKNISYCNKFAYIFTLLLKDEVNRSYFETYNIH